MLFCFINLPFSDRFVSQQVNSLFIKLELPLHIETIRTVLPTKVIAEGVTIKGLDNDTIIRVMDVDAHITLHALMKNKVKLGQVKLGGILVHLDNDSTNTGINIGRTFSKKDKSALPKEKKNFWEISIQRAKLEQVDFKLNDPSNGIHIKENIKELSLRGFKLSLLDRSLTFKEIDLKSSTGGLRISPRLVPQKENKGGPWTFAFDKVRLKDLDYAFNNESDSLMINMMVREGLIRNRETNFSGKKIDTDFLYLSDADIKVFTGQGAKTKNSTPDADSLQFPWDIIIDETDLQLLSFSNGVYSYPAPPDTSGLYGLSQLQMHLIDTRVNNSSANVLVKTLEFRLDNGFVLKEMNGSLQANQDSSQLVFNIISSNSQLALKGKAGEGLFEIIAHPNKISDAQISFYKSSLSLKDYIYFKEDLKEIPSISLLSRDPVIIDGQLGWEKPKLSFSEILISQKDNFNISLDGILKNPDKPKEARGDMILELSARDSLWLNELVKELELGTSYSALSSFSIKGSLSDSVPYSGISLDLKSNLGGLVLSGMVNSQKKEYELKTSFREFFPGRFLGQKSLGAVSGSGVISGRGFKRDSLFARGSLLIDSLNFNDYQYVNTSISGSLENKRYELNILVDDPALKTGLYTTIIQRDSSLILNANATIFAQLDELQYTKDTVSLESTITAELFMTPEMLDSEISLQNLALRSPYEEARVDEIKAYLNMDSTQSILVAHGDFFETDIHVGEALVEFGTFLGYYQDYLLTFIDTSVSASDADYRIAQLPTTNIRGNITYHEALAMVLQDSTVGFGNINFSLSNSASDRSLNYTLAGNDLKYGEIEVGELRASAIDSMGILSVELLADENVFFNNPANKILVNGQFGDWRASTELSALDDSGSYIYHIDLAAKIDSNILAVEIQNQELILNRFPWSIENPTMLTIDLSNKKPYPNLKMQADNSEMRLFSQEVDGQFQYVCRFDQVHLNSLVPDSILPGNPRALISGDFTYEGFEEAKINLNSDLQFNKVFWQGVDFDKIALEGYFNSDTAGNYNMHTLTRIDSSVIDISYNQTSEDIRSLATDFTSLPLSIFQPFLATQLSELGGNISGNFNLNNKGEGAVNGILNFEGASMRVKEVNSKFRLPDEQVKFSENRLVFQDFHVFDSQNNRLDINGFIEIDKQWKVYTDLEILSSGLQVMNTSGDEGESFYGDIFLDSHLSIKGPVSKPIIKGKLILARGSKIFYQYMEDLSLSESAKYVNFVSSSPKAPIIDQFSTSQSKIFESSIETILRIDPATRINFSLSKWAFDINLGLAGEGELSFQMLNNNQHSLSGMYQINEGEANLKLVGWPNKAFRIARGGFIRWDGKIDNPNLKFEASNRVASSYTNPVDGQVRNLDIDVILKLSNQLSDLDVEFSIFTTDQYLMSIINTLSPEEQMRQAITILLFETIDLPGISTSSNYMTQQVNQLVAAQLNSLTKTTIQGIDISFGVNTYVQATEGGGEETRTSLSYDVKKTFADDRAQMRVSGRMNDLYNQPGASSMSLNNISLEYQLDSAASRYLKVYNERSYEDVFEGEVVKTGMGITFRKRYWNLKDIWRRKHKKK